MHYPHVSRIRIYPIKSLDAVELQQAEIGLHSFLHDREFALLANDGRFINGKRTGRVNELKAEYDLEKQVVSLSPRAGGNTYTFHLSNEARKLETYLSEFFEMPVSLIHNTEGQLMDIPNASSVTVLSETSLQSLQNDLTSHSLDDLRLRFRANIEIGGVNAFWEEQLFGEPGEGIEFLIGDVTMIGISPRARCNVPPRDPLTGITDKTFVGSMMKSRSMSISPDSKLLQHGNLYQLTVNTHIPETEKRKMITVGDEIKIIRSVKWNTE